MKNILNQMRSKYIPAALVILSLVMCMAQYAFAADNVTDGVSASISYESVQSPIDGYAAYNIYLDSAKYVSTVIFNMEISGVSDKGTMSISENDCFDVCSSEWERDGSTVSLKGYLGRTGMKQGFSTDEKIKVATILIPAARSADTAAVLKSAECAGIVGEELETKRGTALIDGAVKGVEITSLTKEKAVVAAETSYDAAVILASYKGGALKNMKLIDTTLKSGNNEFALDNLNTAGADTVKVMVLENLSTLFPLCESKYISLN